MGEDDIDLVDLDDVIERHSRSPEALLRMDAEKLPNGTVIRFNYSVSFGMSYLFVAVWVQSVGWWYLSGAGDLLGTRRRYPDLMDILAWPGVSDVQVSTGWADIKV